MAYDHQIIDMSKIIEGGEKYATVIGLIIQELDENKNVIFEWKSLDHIEIIDTDNSIIDLQGQYIDYIHGNSIFIDTDTTLLLSSRNINEITKISRNTGKIIWRLGGKKNQFTFTNDPGFARQHAISRLENGNILLFDNGTGTRTYSRGVEYQIDENKMTVTKIIEFRHKPEDIISPLMGHIQRLDNGNTLIGWGKNIGNNIFSEFDSNGVMIADYSSYDNIKSYRTTKFLWKSNVLYFESDSLKFDTTLLNTESVEQIKLFNKFNYDIEITGYNKSNTPFYILNSFPIFIEAGKSAIINIKFKPSYQGNFFETLLLYSDHLSNTNQIQRIACEIYLNGVGIIGTSTIENKLKKNIILYPNPVKDYIYISCPYLIDNISIYNEIGNRIFLIDLDSPSYKYKIDFSNYYPGIYFIKVNNKNKENSVVRFIKLNSIK